jgi:hypothetical protein
MTAVIAGIWLWLTPIYVLAGLSLVLLAFSLLARVRGGKYVRPIVQGMTKVPLLRRWMQKASRAALEKQNPELASAIAKLERSGVARDPSRAQAALSRLTPAERRAYLEAAGQQGQMPEASNRQERRRLEKLQKRSQGR